MSVCFPHKPHSGRLVHHGRQPQHLTNEPVISVPQVGCKLHEEGGRACCLSHEIPQDLEIGREGRGIGAQILALPLANGVTVGE